MCHEYTAWSFRDEAAAKRRLEEMKREAVRVAARQEEKTRPAPEPKVKAPELEPAE